jgi:hypothetical protein
VVLEVRSDDIQMFDVPPPNELRGIDGYRNGDSWVVTHEHHSFPARD